jgi:tritrans,polycis-undecaprenyl-diphosphate synthase [geranylgeranyl-diphosphate specific]
MNSSIIPRHIAIIPDGNRRFAKKNGKLGYEGHDSGVEKFKKVLSWCKDAKIEEVSFWALSTENLKRDKVELAMLYRILDGACNSILKKSEKELSGVKIRFIGSTELLPEQLQEKLQRVENSTSSIAGLKLNILLAYGGRQELLNAAKSLASDVAGGKLKLDDISEKEFSSRLKLNSKPDLIIRTGHSCLSGFLPWQAAYSEIIFLEGKLWPEFSKEDFDSCLSVFAGRKRNYGL